MQLRPSFKMSVESPSDIKARHDAFAFTSARAISVEFAGCLRSRENPARRGRARHHSRGSVSAAAACHGRHAFVCRCRIAGRAEFRNGAGSTHPVVAGARICAHYRSIPDQYARVFSDSRNWIGYAEFEFEAGCCPVARDRARSSRRRANVRDR